MLMYLRHSVKNSQSPLLKQLILYKDMAEAILLLNAYHKRINT